jgi:hypothetical protein
LTDERLRAAYQAMLARRSPAERAACVTAEALVALVERTGAEDERLATLDHAMACSACRHDLELLRAVEASGGARARRVTPVRIALAASLVLAVAGGVYWRSICCPASDVMRGAGGRIELIAPSGDVTVGATSLIFTWRPTEGAVRYEVEILTRDGTLVYRATTVATSLTLPDSVMSEMRTGGDYAWWVTASLGDGTERRAVPVAFRVTQ